MIPDDPRAVWVRIVRIADDFFKSGVCTIGPSIFGDPIDLCPNVSCLVANGTEGSFQEVENVIPADLPETKPSSNWGYLILFLTKKHNILLGI